MTLKLAALAATLFLASLGTFPAGATQPLFSSATPVAADHLEGPALATALRKGGYTLYFRHTATDFSQTDAAMKSLDDCASQRLLSPEGRRQAVQIGRDMAKLRIPIGEVLASPYCRTRDTATLIFGRATSASAVRGDGGNYDSLGKLLREPVPPGKVRAIVGHGNGMRALAGTPHLAEGEAVVIQVREKSGPVIVGRVGADGWARLEP